jgi:hypothetical protein
MILVGKILPGQLQQGLKGFEGLAQRSFIFAQPGQHNPSLQGYHDLIGQGLSWQVIPHLSGLLGGQEHFMQPIGHLSEDLIGKTSESLVAVAHLQGSVAKNASADKTVTSMVSRHGVEKIIQSLPRGWSLQ